jgi:hypothetical protein
MVEIKVDPSVLAAMRKAFPSPPNSATRQFYKYVGVLQDMLLDSLLRGQTVEEMKCNLFSISLHELANKGGVIGGNDKVRVHKWLNDHGLALVETVKLGSNLTGMVSKVKFTDLVSLEMPPATNLLANGQQALTSMNNPCAKTTADLIDHLYPDFAQCVADQTLDKVFDAVSIDIKSLENYMQWLRKGATMLSTSKRKQFLLQAHVILSVAKDKGGKYYQRKKTSDFGRTYYAGISVQNVNKELRRAMLGNCWEYDIRSSVVAWKMGFATECIAALNLNGTVRDNFKHTLSYLEDKKGLMATLHYLVFGKDSEVPVALQGDLLKQAFTALSFGARKTAKAWVDQNGEWARPAMVEIFRIKEERDRFLNDVSVVGFVKEQAKLDDYLFNGIKQQRPDLLKLPYLQTQSGSASKSKCVAFLYQHEETAVMEVVRAALAAHGKTVLAKIHDAIITKEKLGVELTSEIEQLMRDETNNDYWRLSAKQLKRYATPSPYT